MAQTEKLIKIDENVTIVDNNATAAHSEIVKAEAHQKGTGKCIYWIVGISLIVVIVVIIFVVVL